MPEEFTGGLGLEGTLALKKFAEQGGTIVALDGASDFAIQQFGLPVENVVSGVSSKQFFIPGSLVKIKLPAAMNMPPTPWQKDTFTPST